MKGLVDTKVKEVETATLALVPKNKSCTTNLGPLQLKELNCMNMRLVLLYTMQCQNTLKQVRTR